MSAYVIFSFLLSIIMILTVISLVRNNKLHERHSIFWLVFSLIIMVLSLFPHIIDALARLLHIDYAPSLLFLIGIIFLIIYNIYATTLINQHSEKINKLAQEISIMKSELEEKSRDEGN